MVSIGLRRTCMTRGEEAMPYSEFTEFTELRVRGTRRAQRRTEWGRYGAGSGGIANFLKALSKRRIVFKRGIARE